MIRQTVPVSASVPMQQGMVQNRMMLAGQQNVTIRQGVPGGFPQRAPVPQQQPQQQQQAQAAQDKLDDDPIVKAKVILPHLKEALINLMAVASQNFAVSVAVDEMQKAVDSSTIPRFDKCLEHFFTLCDQLEAQLMLAHQQLSQTLISIHHAQPSLRNVNFKTDPNGPQLYGSYLNQVELQMHFAKEIYNSLNNCCNKLAEHQTTFTT